MALLDRYLWSCCSHHHKFRLKSGALGREPHELSPDLVFN